MYLSCHAHNGIIKMQFVVWPTCVTECLIQYKCTLKFNLVYSGSPADTWERLIQASPSCVELIILSSRKASTSKHSVDLNDLLGKDEVSDIASWLLSLGLMGFFFCLCNTDYFCTT